MIPVGLWCLVLPVGPGVLVAPALLEALGDQEGPEVHSLPWVPELLVFHCGPCRHPCRGVPWVLWALCTLLVPALPLCQAAPQVLPRQELLWLQQVLCHLLHLAFQVCQETQTARRVRCCL